MEEDERLREGKFSFVIVGGGIAGVSCIEEVRKSP
jgi:glycerol-3-phosphate dehydrogenase